MATSDNDAQTSTQASMPSDDGTHCAFFYGTLMAADVFHTVCYGTKDVPEEISNLHTSHPAVLHGFCRRRVKYADYPGIIEDKDHNVVGTFVTGLTNANMARLDHFEGSQYERRPVTVSLLKKLTNGKLGEGTKVEAETYIFLNKRDLESREWDLEEFRREKMQRWTR
ncbi:hypothetical protein CHGG_02445 [Chaetomium globosum CBS 148.51]|uniref:Putative gamma-glutamylcyclotransferase n=1 Tax=Chaetomium globosum (strain ATCC 6205 / CBS 148.51 / DSM 1962 / NBRC 6347 / NRRL 1970) TaxID=306901 RepID=Q2HBF9_CHAGB|nr:uncharacterized protein CHGG_02445 [Chaetomium globosum CBS 148.51]EAQ90510.1 hypothetical protein CHGG_02445 [Chaetomium globosum CBS 148.51]